MKEEKKKKKQRFTIQICKRDRIKFTYIFKNAYR